MPAQTNTATVVIPWGGSREDLLVEQLEALRAQRLDRVSDVTVVIGVNSAGAVSRASDLESDGHRIRVRAIDASAVRGPSFARNAGWRISTGDVVLFCDADDVADPGWVEAMVRAADRFDVVGGRLVFDRLNPPDAAKARGRYPSTLPSKFDHLPFAPSCSMAVRRAVLERVGGWDDELIDAEDIDLSWRVQYSGGTIGMATEAVMHYRLRTTFRATYRNGFKYGQVDGDLLRKHAVHGARRTPTATLRSLAGVAMSVPPALVMADRRLVLADRVGVLAGRVAGSVRARTWAL